MRNTGDRLGVLLAGALWGAMSGVALGCSTPDGGAWPFGGDGEPDSTAPDLDAESRTGDVDSRCNPANADTDAGVPVECFELCDPAFSCTTRDGETVTISRTSDEDCPQTYPRETVPAPERTDSVYEQQGCADAESVKGCQYCDPTITEDHEFEGWQGPYYDRVRNVVICGENTFEDTVGPRPEVCIPPS